MWNTHNFHNHNTEIYLNIENLAQKIEEDSYIYSCQKGWIVSTCPHCNRKYVRPLLCGRENCPTCGEYMGWLHRRRIARWWDKVMQMRDIGYIVITFPQEYWDRFLDKKMMNEFASYIRRKLKRMGVKRGLYCWHFSSDKKNFSIFYPHLNILIEFRYLEVWEKFKKDIAKWLSKKLSKEWKVVVANYQYYKNCSISKKIHLLKYLTRPTGRNLSDLVLDKFKGMHNYRWWGKWEKIRHEHEIELRDGYDSEIETKDEYEVDFDDYIEHNEYIEHKEVENEIDEERIEYDGMTEEDIINKGYCPFCGSKLKWRYKKTLKRYLFTKLTFEKVIGKTIIVRINNYGYG